MSGATSTADDTTVMDLDRLDRFMAKALTGSEDAPVSRRQLTGGMSQMTIMYRPVGADGTPASDQEQLVVRVPPLAGPLEPYDPYVEGTLMTTVGGFGIAVPEVALIEDTGEAIGRPFYVTRFVRGAMTAEGTFGPDADLDRMAKAYVDQLVALHNVPVDQAGVAGVTLSNLLGKMPEKTPAAVIDRWTEAVASRDLRVPVYQQFLREWLLMRRPEDDGRRAVAHGDYRLANMLWSGDSEIAAAMDWEEAGLGDPYADLAWTLIGTFDDDDDVLGLASRRWIIDRYAAQAGIDLDYGRLLWWEVASGWTLLCMNAVAIGSIVRGDMRDVRPLLYCYLNRRIAAGPLRKIEAYEKGH
jgi:aminoglycoside phosphotransferase (APT) family kinase protein